MKSRSVFKINDVTVTAQRVRTITSLFIDIHGQHEHQSLLYKYKHLEILDLYGAKDIADVKKKLADSYQIYVTLVKRLKTFSMEEEARLREVDFLKFEINEIESACLKAGEEEALELSFKRFENSKVIAESMSGVTAMLGGDEKGNMGELIARALLEVKQVLSFDDSVRGIFNQLTDMEAILTDTYHDCLSYSDGMSFDAETYREVRDRLDLIRTLYAKYGRTYEQVMESLNKKKERLCELIHYEENKNATMRACAKSKKQVLAYCAELSALRKQAALPLCERIRQSLLDLNFLQVSFDMHFEQAGQFGINGYDDAEFVISTNPGQPMQPLGEVASGGELSRIMLAVKSVLADTDRIPTLIFDEIDTGISGRTAACVSDKLSLISENHQVLCITHLPQIASHADSHFMIAKDIVGSKTCTTITNLSAEDSVKELARLLGGTVITEAVLENARELKAAGIRRS